ncbi:helix-turn-helix transcriptional regulator [Pontiella agarivorans]|uniref:AraC family transcriptional regulator n=1 Tax=Pontiella agarivorans TaxID=3038953 RepID=A0ABU5MS30_9BACT|nr:AraC family transcriptional regulator [Pontiella agarivorans]MDZ8117010.1 AraC family transcriptional regulator [Pontiella agarivorans]
MLDVLKTIQIDIVGGDRSELGTEWRGIQMPDPYTRLYWIESGSGHIHYNNQDRPLRAKELHLIPSNNSFEYSCEKQVVIHWVRFSATLLGGIDLFAYIDCERKLIPDNQMECKKMFLDLFSAQQSDRKGKAFYSNGTLMQLLAFFMDTIDSEAIQLKLKQQQCFQPVLKAIEQTLADPLSVAELARLTSLEPSYFSRKFTRFFGESPQRYIMRRRINQAQLLLWETNETIQQIADALGFYDAFHLSKAFKRMAGISPSSYRTQASRIGP